MIKIQNLYKAFSSTPLFNNAYLEIYEKERIAILAPNGKGKTTLLKLLLKQDTQYEGQIEIQGNLKIQSLDQEIPNTQESLLNYSLSIFPEKKTLEKIRLLEKDLATQPHNQELLDKYSQILSLFEKNGGYDFIYEAKKILEGMGFLEQDFNRPLNSFSGGEERRALLAVLLVQKPHVLILDEPTNHLDIKNTIFLENFLKNYPGALIFVSHDKEFVNQVATHVCEIENKQFFKYKGNLNSFTNQKQDIYNQKFKELEILKAEHQKLFDFVSRFKAGTRASQASSKEKNLLEVKEKISQITLPSFLNPTLQFMPQDKIKAYEPPLQVKNLEKKFEDRILLKDVSFTLKRGEKTALIGINGSGKSTLFKILAKKDSHYTGNVIWNQQVITGYYAQEGFDLEGNFKNPYEALLHSYGNNYQDQEIKNFLSNFRLPFETSIPFLSGGEKSKLKLLMLLLSKANFLLLDEPTNHLDLYSIDGLKEILLGFKGNILMVTHDRNLMKDIKPEILFLDQQKITPIYFNHFDQILSKLTNYDFSKKEKEKKERVVKKRPKNFTKELEKIENLIEKTEEKLQEIINKMAKKEVYSNYILLQELEDEKKILEKELEKHFNQWEEMQSET